MKKAIQNKIDKINEALFGAPLIFANENVFDINEVKKFVVPNCDVEWFANGCTFKLRGFDLTLYYPNGKEVSKGKNLMTYVDVVPVIAGKQYTDSRVSVWLNIGQLHAFLYRFTK